MTDLDLTIPDFCKISDEQRRQAWENFRKRMPAQEPAPASGSSEQVKRHKLRKLRAEERRLSNLIDEIGNRDQAARRKLYDAIKVVEKEIERVEAAR